MVTKKARTEYMKKFRDPKWETFSKCYEDSLKYRLTRRLMEHSHRPWVWEGWDSGSDSSGWSTPRLTRNKVAPLSLPPPACSEVQQKLLELKTSPGPEPSSEAREADLGAGEAPVVDAAPTTAPVVENGVNGTSGQTAVEAPNTSGPSCDTTTDNGPAHSPSSDEEPVNPAPRRCHRRRTPRSELGRKTSSPKDKPTVVQKPPRAKSQPPVSTKENGRLSSRPDWTETQMEPLQVFKDSPELCFSEQQAQGTENGAVSPDPLPTLIIQPHGAHFSNRPSGFSSQSNTSDACVQTRRDSDKRKSNPDRRRARSADLEKMRRAQLSVVDDRWMTEYMRCFSARLR